MMILEWYQLHTSHGIQILGNIYDSSYMQANPAVCICLSWRQTTLPPNVIAQNRIVLSMRQLQKHSYG